MRWEHIIKDGKTNDRKWEFKQNGVVLGTIYRRPGSRPPLPPQDECYSLWVSVPFIFQRNPVGQSTHKFETLEEAQKAFVDLCREQALPWCKEIVDFFGTTDV